MARSTLALVLLSIFACSEDRQPPPQDDGGSSTSGTTGPAAGSSSTGVASGTGAAESTGPHYPLPTEDELLQCVRSCEVPFDCCPASAMGMCPSAMYPYNFACIDGLCIAPPCTSDDECVNEGEACVTIRGYPRCVVPCDGDDAACTAVDPSLSCSGTADDMSLYCFAHCENPGVFCGNQTCDAATGECVCTSSGMCQVDWECV